ncbi:MAG: T9SS type A sorting domain-containing protein [Ignavibacteria bacterium]|nr:T9SS type A sorting domain-containing protein [Ignavibacteria bacterium]
MKNTIISAAIIVMFFISVSVFSFPSYTGYSGAPGSSGNCASTCHGSSGGTIQISGFPTQYTPGQAYIITISHNGGQTIRNFNGSCRIGTGSSNAGVISAGTSTSVYNTAGETNGVHLSSNSLNSATFNWTAPSSGTGTVKLYIAGHQGSKNDPNTNIILTATEIISGIPGINGNIPTEITLFQNYPNPFNSETIISYSVPKQGNVKLDIYNVAGEKMETMVDGYKESGYYMIAWDASNYASGVYYYRLTVGDRDITKRMTLLK